MTSFPAKKRFENGKPNLVIVHPPGTLNDYPFSIDGYKKSYLAFMRLASQQCNVYYIRGKNNHRGQGIFKKGYKMINGKLEPYPHTIYGRILYNKTRLRANGGRDWDIINKELLYKMTQNKFKTYQLFRQYMKPTYRIRTKKQFIRALKKINTNWVVFKPLRGAEGRGIVISPKKTLLNKMKIYTYEKKRSPRRHTKYDGLLQEFIDTQRGIPGIHKTYHDMRILIMNGQIVQTYIRIPKPGTYLANIAQGGSMKEIKKSSVPRSTKKIALAIDQRFRRYGARVYAIDFGFENGKPYLIEINPQPGLPYPQWSMYYHAWHRQLVRTLLSTIK